MRRNIEKVIAVSGLDTPEVQWQYSIKRYTGIFYPIIKPFNTLFINIKYGKDKDLVLFMRNKMKLQSELYFCVDG